MVGLTAIDTDFAEQRFAVDSNSLRFVHACSSVVVRWVALQIDASSASLGVSKHASARTQMHRCDAQLDFAVRRIE
jgi:hypothetical protein